MSVGPTSRRPSTLAYTSATEVPAASPSCGRRRPPAAAARRSRPCRWPCAARLPVSTCTAPAGSPVRATTRRRTSSTQAPPRRRRSRSSSPVTTASTPTGREARLDSVEVDAQPERLHEAGPPPDDLEHVGRGVVAGEVARRELVERRPAGEVVVGSWRSRASRWVRGTPARRHRAAGRGRAATRGGRLGSAGRSPAGASTPTPAGGTPCGPSPRSGRTSRRGRRPILACARPTCAPAPAPVARRPG